MHLASQAAAYRSAPELRRLKNDHKWNSTASFGRLLDSRASTVGKTTAPHRGAEFGEERVPSRRRRHLIALGLERPQQFRALAHPHQLHVIPNRTTPSSNRTCSATSA